MPIPLATTYITVMGRRPQDDVDPSIDGYDTPGIAAPVVLATEVRACISQGAGSRASVGVRETDSYSLRCDKFPDGLTNDDLVVDEDTTKTYRVTKVMESDTTILGLEHIHAEIRLEKGLTGGVEGGTA